MQLQQIPLIKKLASNIIIVNKPLKDKSVINKDAM